jgi:DNA-binding XRE family transcriptional regulator
MSTVKKKSMPNTGFEEWAAGTKRLRITRMDKDGNRAVFRATKAELEEKERRLSLFTGIRHKLGFSQATMAKAIHVSKRTVEAWEIGRGKMIPDYAIAMAELLRDIPEVRRRLLAA